MTDPSFPQQPQQPQQPLPSYPQTAPGYQQVPQGSAPGKTLGIVAFILAFLAAPIGLILGIVAIVQSKKAGGKNGLAIAAIIIGALVSIFWVIMLIVMIAVGAQAAEAAQACLDGAESVTLFGQTVSCSQVTTP